MPIHFCLFQVPQWGIGHLGDWLQPSSPALFQRPQQLPPVGFTPCVMPNRHSFFTASSTPSCVPTKLELSSSLPLCICEFPFMVIWFLCGLCVWFYLGRIKTQVFSRTAKMLCIWCQNLCDLVATTEVQEKSLAFRSLYVIATNRVWPVLSCLKGRES